MSSAVVQSGVRCQHVAYFMLLEYVLPSNALFVAEGLAFILLGTVLVSVEVVEFRVSSVVFHSCL